MLNQLTLTSESVLSELSNYGVCFVLSLHFVKSS